MDFAQEVAYLADLNYLAVALGFVLLSWGFIILCQALSGGER